MPPEEVPPDALVIRFKPTSPDAVLRSAQKEYRRTERYGCSVFADIRRHGESEEHLRWRLLQASELAGRLPPPNDKYFVCARAGDLLDRGMSFWKDGDDDEVVEHYSVVIGDNPDVSDAEKFLEPFGQAEERPTCQP